jgi:hypothetical protein
VQLSEHSIFELNSWPEVAVAKTDDSAYAAVEAALRQNPQATQDELWEKAKEASPGVARLSRREFNARYPLQIKRKLQREAGGGGAGARKRAAGAKRAGRKAGGRKGRRAAAAAAAGGAGAEAAAPARRRPGRPKGSGRKAAPAQAAAGSAERESIRQALLGFATEVVSAADQPKNLVKLLANVDRYVDRVVKSRG